MLIAQMLNHLFRIVLIAGNEGPLMNSRKECRTPKRRADCWKSRTKDDETWQVLVFRSQSVTEPRSHGGMAGYRHSQIETEKSRAVIGPVCNHGANDTNIIDSLR